MEEQANKILVELLQKASNGIDAAVSFSQAQIPDVVHQLLLWNMVDSLIKTLMAILTIPLVFWFMKKQCQRVETGKIGDEGYSWEKGNPKYRPTMVWDSKGDINLNRPGFPGECFICELRLPDHYFRWKHNKLFLLLPEEYGPAFPAIVDCYTSPPT